MKAAMRFRRCLVGLALGAAVAMCLASVAHAATVTVSVSGAPTIMAPNTSASFTITLSAATGNLPSQHSPSDATVHTEYTLSSLSAAPVSETYARVGQNLTSGGNRTISATVFAPANIQPGDYTVSVRVSLGSGLDLPDSTPAPSFVVTVPEPTSDDVCDAPVVQISAPGNHDRYLVGYVLTALVSVTSQCEFDVWATLNDEAVALEWNEESEYFESIVTLGLPGENTFEVCGANVDDETCLLVTFDVGYDFGRWLPPITTSKFQRGRTLPVKFTVLDANGPTDAASAAVLLGDDNQGTAAVEYDDLGLPYYQLNVKLPNVIGSYGITADVENGGKQNQGISVK